MDQHIRILKKNVVNGNETPLFRLPWMLAFHMQLPSYWTTYKLENPLEKKSKIEKSDPELRSRLL